MVGVHQKGNAERCLNEPVHVDDGLYHGQGLPVGKSADGGHGTYICWMIAEWLQCAC
jgi:hypothetical protein